MRNISTFGALLASCLFASAAQAATIEWNGFGSAYYGQALTDEVRPGNLRKGQAEFGRLSKVGLNLSSQLSEDFDVAAQFVAGGSGFAGIPESEWDMTVNWAFLTYKATDTLRIKAGRQLFPNWLAAEFIEVGYLQPFREMPQALSLISPFRSFEGVLLEQSFKTGAGTLVASAWTGSSDREFETMSDAPSTLGAGTQLNTRGSINVKDFYGASLTWNGDGYRLRGQVSQSYGSLTTTSFVSSGTPNSIVTTGETKPLLWTVGGNYDKNNFVVWAEYGKQSSANKNQIPKGYLANMEGYYALLGYRIGKLMPKIMYTDVDNTQSNFTGIDGKEQIMSAGFNYEINSNIIMKAEYEYGMIPVSTAAKKDGASWDRDSTITNNTEDTGQAIYVGVDFIF